MCEERRADVQRVSLGGDVPKQRWSLNFTSVQALVWLVSKLAATIIGLWAGISFVAGYQFERSLESFHKDAKPAIYQAIEDAIRLHKVEAEVPMIERLHKIENQAGAYDERLKSLKENSDRNTAELRDANQKLDRILERLADR
jgi:hypothetical protein